MKPKVGCFLIYSIVLILLGMGLYKYRTEILDYISQKYNDLVAKAAGKIESSRNDIKDNIQ